MFSSRLWDIKIWNSSTWKYVGIFSHSPFTKLWKFTSCCVYCVNYIIIPEAVSLVLDPKPCETTSEHGLSLLWSFVAPDHDEEDHSDDDDDDGHAKDGDDADRKMFLE